jgi:hypothetical protein
VFSSVKIGKMGNFDFSRLDREIFVNFTLLFRRGGAEKIFWIILFFPLDKLRRSDNITVQEKIAAKKAAKSQLLKRALQ